MSFSRKAKIAVSTACCLLASVLISSCASSPKDLETPRGPVPGEQFGSMEIIGIIGRATTTLNRQNNTPQFSEDVTLNVPVGTEFIVPVVRGWRLGFGEVVPNTLEAHIGTSQDPAGWKTDDHHLGLAAVNIFVKDINAPDTASNTQTATINVGLFLGDHNYDDRWFGLVNYTLICLRRQPTGSPSPSPSPPPIP